MANYTLPDNWASLPIREAVMGGVKKKVKVDEENEVIYLLDERGDWTGEKCRNPKAVPQKDAPNYNSPTDTEASSEANAEEEKPIRKKKPKKSKLTSILIVIIIILGSLLILQNTGNTPQGGQYAVIVAMQNIQPGESIDGKLASVNLSAEEYRKYTSSSGLYLANEYADIQNYVATSFIPKNSYIAYNNVDKNFQATNPWTLPGGKEQISLPIDLTKDKLEEFMWGNIVTITIKATRFMESEDYPNASRPSAPEVSGSSKLETYQVDTFTITGITIVDMLNAQGKSLYSTYLAMSTIPSKYQSEHFTTRYGSVDAVYADTPAYISVAVDKESAELWDFITSVARRYSISVSLEKTGADCETEFQSNTHEAIKKILTPIQAAWASAQEEE